MIEGAVTHASLPLFSIFFWVRYRTKLNRYQTKPNSLDYQQR